MMMTAAGTIPAAKVFCDGRRRRRLAGDRHGARLGAVVTATDVRPATKEQVESLGAKFLAVEDEEFKNAQTAGGYAKEMSKDKPGQTAAFTRTAPIPERAAAAAGSEGAGEAPFVLSAWPFGAGFGISASRAMPTARRPAG